jgi:glycosyltransferase involved in cell wall biosynthesis
MNQTLEQQAHTHNNDYSHLEAIYRQTTGGELVRDPYASMHYTGPDVTLSASIVIPAWNAYDTLEQCLIAIEQSSFNRKYPEQLEAVVVDDGSSDGTWELLQRLQLNVRLKAIQQRHHSRAHTQNTGIALAEGDVIICCDADMILTPFTIEELVKRHQLCEHVMLIGFRADVQASDPRIQPAVLAEHLPRFLPPFAQDMRVHCGAGGWPESMCRDSDHLKRLGGGKQIIMADGGRWDLAGIGWGTLFSLRRSDFVAMDGYDERFYGWGCEDSLVGVRAQALKNYIIPVYSAAGLHIAHGNRSPRKWQEFSANQRVFHMILRSPFTGNNRHWLDRAKHRVQQHFERTPHARLEMCSHLYDVFVDELRDADRRGKYLHCLGRYDEAASAFAEVCGTAEQEAWAMFNRGKALRVGGHPDQATALLEEAATCLPTSPGPLIEQALALAAQGRFGEAYHRLELAREIDPANSWLGFLLQRPAQRHMERASFYMRQGDYMLALWDYEAALILDPRNAMNQIGRTRALVALDQQQTAKEALASYVHTLGLDDIHSSLARLELARLHLALGEVGTAKAVLEQARRLHSHNQEVSTCMTEIHALAAKTYPLPLTQSIVRQSQAIPGWFGEDETELLLALTLRVAACCSSTSPLTLIEIGSYCGRATVAMGLTIQGLGRTDVRIVAVDEPTLGLAPDGRSPREVLRSQLATYELSSMVVCAPEEDQVPWERASQLLFVDGQHDYESVRGDVERYSPQLAPGGFLVFHDYADYFPDVQRYVNELLLASSFQFVAQASSLIALMRQS